MRSTLEITTAATDLQLLTIEQMRAAAGVTGSGQDTILQARGLGVAAAIMAECNIAVGSGNGPTLKRETLTETFYLASSSAELLLGRRHEIEIDSVTVNGVELDADSYNVNAEDGILYRVCARWPRGTVVVVYDAGFDTVPGDLEAAALDFFRAVSLESDRDPFVKSERVEIPGVESRQRDFWVGSVPGSAQSESAVPDIVSGQLKRFRNPDEF